MNLEQQSESLAREVFLHIRDKKGNPAILHTERVALSGATEEERITGWLHDVVEDTPVTLDDLRKKGFPEEIVLAVEALSRQEHETYVDFIERVSANALATKVKIHDLNDNRKRCYELGPKAGKGLYERYTKALERLTPLLETKS